MTASALSRRLAAWRAEIDQALERFLPRPPACPHSVSEAMRYSLFAGGKRLRPILALAAAEGVAEQALAELEADRRGASLAARVALALPVACAVEFIHTYSLVHDDLPAMDNDTLRRGRPTAHVVYGEGMAILAGDALLTEAFRLMANEPADQPGVGDRKLRAIGVVAAAAGAEGMVGGQAIDLLAVGSRAAASGATTLDAAGLQGMHARKTGALIRAACVAGAIMAGADDRQTTAVDEYAADLGLAFQIVDDILDVEGEAAQLGKTAGKDAAAGKPTYPALHGLEPSRRLAAECVDRARATLRRAGLSGHLAELADWVVARTR